MNKSFIIVSILVSAGLIVGAIWLSKGDSLSADAPADNVSIVDGRQIIEITAKGGYQPRKTFAAAGIPTVIRFDTTGTFDCSASVRIPSLSISQTLPFSGETEIDLGTPEPGVIQGSCSMGMFPFELVFS